MSQVGTEQKSPKTMSQVDVGQKDSGSRPKGNRNLIILGIGAIIITIAFTSLSLIMYRLSGDIYLDRSRPGFLPDEEETISEPTVDSGYNFPDSGVLDRNDLETYLEELGHILDELEAYEDVYSPSPLSDESLGIPSELKEN